MEYELIMSNKAKLGLLGILENYIENESLQRTEKVENSINSVLTRITGRPFSNKIYENLNHPHYKLRRAVVHKTNIIIYEVILAQIIIIDIFDGRRNPEKFTY